MRAGMVLATKHHETRPFPAIRLIFNPYIYVNGRHAVNFHECLGCYL
jgi:hypothetical protein